MDAALDPVTLEYDGAVAIVTLNDPKTLNALTFPMFNRLREVLDEVELKARAMILSGSGKSFCSGANLAGGLSYKVEDPKDADCGEVLETHVNPAMSRLRTLNVPWVSAVRGSAAGAGASLALAGDLVVASETATFIQAFSRIGLVPDAGATHLLVRTIGRVRANELMLLGGKLSAEKALDWGLVNKVVADEKLEEEAMALASALANGPASIAAIRRLSWMAVDATFNDTLWNERELQRNAGRTEDFREGTAAFLEKRPAQFKGR